MSLSMRPNDICRGPRTSNAGIRYIVRTMLTTLATANKTSETISGSSGSQSNRTAKKKAIHLNIGKLHRLAVASSAPLTFNSAVLPLVRCYSFVVPGGYLVESIIIKHKYNLGRTSLPWCMMGADKQWSLTIYTEGFFTLTPTMAIGL